MTTIQYYFDWDFTKLETTSKIGNHSDVVTKVYWTMWGSDSQGNRVPMYGSTDIPTAEFQNAIVENWVEYASLTKEHVEELLENALGEDELVRMTDQLKVQLEQLEEEVKITVQVPPWVQ